MSYVEKVSHTFLISLSRFIPSLLQTDLPPPASPPGDALRSSGSRAAVSHCSMWAQNSTIIPPFQIACFLVGKKKDVRAHKLPAAKEARAYKHAGYLLTQTIIYTYTNRTGHYKPEPMI